MSYQHIHFIGIGGIGMSGLAFIAMRHGIKSSGCDNNVNQETIRHIEKNGALIGKNHGSQCCFDRKIDLYVYSSAINTSLKEIAHAQKFGIPVIHRSELLAYFLKKKYGIAISGTHGKTTTTSLVGHLFLEALQKPTILVGGMVKSFNGNSIVNHDSDLFIFEADESDQSFLQLPSKIKLITTIDYEHPETYTQLSHIEESFTSFIEKPDTETIFVSLDNESIDKIISRTEKKIVSYSIHKDYASIYAMDIKLSKLSSTFTVYNPYTKPFDITLNIPGLHNVSNSLGAIAIGLFHNIHYKTIQAALLSFQLPDRRFSIRGITKSGITIIDDYAHHPTEIKSLIVMARNFAQKKLIMIFQPHRYQRTLRLWNDFVTILSSSMIDYLYVTDIYPAGEKPISGINSEILTRAIQEKSPKASVEYIPFGLIKEKILKNCAPTDTVIFTGAGNIYQIGLTLINT